MIALRIEDIKHFTSKLFVGETFDEFLMKEVSIVTFNLFTMDGHIRHGYYTEEELEESKVEEFSTWRMVKPLCFSVIKGKKLPGSFQIVLQLSPSGVREFLNSRQIPMNEDQITGLYINIRYEEGKLYCVTGTSVSFFTMDKTLDQEWDGSVKEFLKQSQIEFVEE
jgi:hypothetical protein